MNRTLLLRVSILIAPALIVLLASPGMASTRIPALKCGPDPCLFKLSGHAVELNFGGNRIRCRMVTGLGSLDRRSGSSLLILKNCRERVTVFNFRCSNSKAHVGTVHTSPMGTELRPGADQDPKIVFLGLRATFRCARVMKFYVEGFLVGHLDRSQCNAKRFEYPIEPVLFAHGGIGSEPAYDIYVDANTETYKVPTPWQMRFRHNVTLEC
jgi:hypothetical protein